ncbi:MAG: glycerate kinase [Anaerolineae bacterium]
METKSIAESRYRDAIIAMLQAALAAVDPELVVCQHVKREGRWLLVGDEKYNLDEVEKLWVVGGGKAAVPMVVALWDIVGERIAGGVVVTKYGHAGPDLATGPVAVIEAGHPVPDENGVAGARQMAGLLQRVGERDLVLAVISGGGSALLTLPAGDLTLDDLQATTGLLLRSGATIVELNKVRKHLSRIKGGGLARLGSRARIAGLVLSDVVGDPLDVIASGPLSADPTTFADAWGILAHYALLDQVPAGVRARLQAGCDGEVADTPKPGDALFDGVQTTLVGSNRLAASAAVKEGLGQGLNAFLLSTYVEGEAREVARVASALAKELVFHDQPVARPACLVWGGETTVTVRGEGKGGRNQELALAAALALDGLPEVVLVALGTDGTDGPTDAAGAVATGETIARATALGLDARAHLADNDAYPFLDSLGDLIRTGPTGTNVNDLLFIFALA